MIKCLSWLLLSSLFISAIPAKADPAPPITSIEITARTLAALSSCLHYKVKGVCFWELDGIITTTAYLEHYLPDVVVSVFNKPDENPWIELRETIDPVGAVTEKTLISAMAHTESGGGQHEFNDTQQQNTFFKAADVVGNPALMSLPTESILLPSAASPLNPYFQSMLDSALWRGFPPQAEPEQAYALLFSLTRYIGKDAGAVTWGSAIPFEGKIATSNDGKAAAVIAQRASNLLTTEGLSSWGHLYQPLSTVCGRACDVAKIKERDDDTQFQMIYPVTETTCQVFGKTISFGEEAEVKTQGAYLWVLWRKYNGCIDGMGTYVGRTP
jgi:integrating conjugative element protein (TIGR03756 family)